VKLLIIRQEDKRDYPFVFELNQLAFGQENEAKLVDALRKNVFMAIELVSDGFNNVSGMVQYPPEFEAV
jgi:predicted N-acetyltransferase YhbS